jgi:hypothetical protein
MELIQQLVTQLGVNETAAKGGAGLLFQLAQSKLATGDFSKIAGVVPGINDLLKAAPQDTGALGSLGKIASGFGGGAAQLGNLASLAGGFSKLGLDSGMIGKFMPIILSFVQSKGGDVVKTLLEKALK